MAPPMQKWIPDGWSYVDHVEPNGFTVKCYINVLGQKFFSWKDLMHFIKYAKKEKISIYAEDFDPSKLNNSNSSAAESHKLKNVKPHSKATKEHINMQSTINPHCDAEKEKKTDNLAGEKCLLSPVIASDQAEGNTDAGVISLPAEGSEKNIHPKKRILTAAVDDITPHRASRRLAGLQPEYVLDVGTSQAQKAASKHVFRRASRRLAGLEPEHVLDFVTNKSWQVAPKRHK